MPDARIAMEFGMVPTTRLSKAEKFESLSKILERAYECLSMAEDAGLTDISEKMLKIIDHTSWSLENNKPYMAAITIDGLNVACAVHSIGKFLYDKVCEEDPEFSKSSEGKFFKKKIDKSLSETLKTFW